jgi:hypothetical protein
MIIGNNEWPSVSDLISAHDNDGLHTRFQEVMESHEMSSMAALAQEFIKAYIEFDQDTDDVACLKNVMEILAAIERITTAQPCKTKAAFVKEIELKDPDTGNPVGVSMYKLSGGGMVGIDASFLEQHVGPVFSPFDQGVLLELGDEGEETKDKPVS